MVKLQRQKAAGDKNTQPACKTMPKTAMLLAAGLGTRLRPLTQNLPKPLVSVAGRTLLERALDMLAAAGIEKTIINCHYQAKKLTDFVQKIAPHYPMKLCISDESARLLDSAGGIIKALPLLGQKPFFVLNADTFWREPSNSAPNLQRLAQHFNPVRHDMLLLTVSPDHALLPQAGDFIQNAGGSLKRADKSRKNSRDVIYTGALILNPAIFADTKTQPETPLSLNLYFDRAIAANRLCGLHLQGRWYSIGSQAEMQKAEMSLH